MFEQVYSVYFRFTEWTVAHQKITSWLLAKLVKTNTDTRSDMALIFDFKCNLGILKPEKS